MGDNFLGGRIAMVTGGASGMGLAIAQALASAGARVAIGSLLAGGKRAEGELTYLPGQEQMDQALSQLGSDSIGMNLDVTSDASVDDFHRVTVERLGPIDILVNAAGITAEQTIVGHDDGLWNKVLEVNLTGTYRAIKRVLPSMIERKWGRIINLASTFSFVGFPEFADYCSSKGGVALLTKTLAAEWAPS